MVGHSASLDILTKSLVCLPGKETRFPVLPTRSVAIMKTGLFQRPNFALIRTRRFVRSLQLLEPTTSVLFLEEVAMSKWPVLLSPLNKSKLVSNHCGRGENFHGL